ncbi:MAG: hypothetical protein HKN00_11170 [Flavobacteriaceae bacterium]|nr:hypothetical protein [Bacteroidia bacterium]MBT8287576.1 hypothetical protein [Bacteroidia bacterium]NNF75738.1 hypothetical protein [Flavobacteriaceae bacterium]NNK74088.1 hypothetical protein [Flavobacteriaceae bacterium]
MRQIAILVSILFLFTGCQPDTNKAEQQKNEETKAAFERNSETVLSMLASFENEKPDYSMHADDFVSRATGFGAEQDSIFLKDVKLMDKINLERYDFKLLTNPPVLLPGVNPETNEMDGSVRYYVDWEVSKAATDSTPARSGIVKMYQSVDFNEAGKITYVQTYGDFTGLLLHLNNLIGNEN